MDLSQLPATKVAAIAAGIDRYFTSKPCKYGHISYRLVSDPNCVVCKSIYNLARHKKNKEKHRASVLKWRESKKQDWLKSARKYAQNNKAKRAFWQRSRDARKRLAFPVWADKEKIKKFYENRPAGFEVDHIIPLNSPVVCGLHVHNNLQYLPKQANASKHNKFDPMKFEA